MSLVKYDSACRAIAEAKAIDEIASIRDQTVALKEAARVAKNKQAQIDWSEIHIRAERKLGEMLQNSDRNKGAAANALEAAEGVETLADLGVSYDLSSRAQHIASIPDEEFEETLAEHREEQKAVSAATMEKLAKKNVLATKYTGDEEWYTPAPFIESARRVMGSIDCDPASNPHANKIVQAGTIYTKEDNGLDKKWRGNVWLNPPYTSGYIDKFIDKLIYEVFCGDADQAIILTNNNTDTNWWHKLYLNSNAMCFTKGRISFYKETGEYSSPTNGQCFTYFGVSTSDFRSEFRKHGAVFGVAL